MYHLLQHSTTQVLALKGEETDLTKAVVFPSETREEQGCQNYVFKGVISMAEQRIDAG